MKLLGYSTQTLQPLSIEQGYALTIELGGDTFTLPCANGQAVADALALFASIELGNGSEWNE